MKTLQLTILIIFLFSINIFSQTYRVGDANYIYLRTGTDVTNGLAWYGTGKLFASEAPNGPVLFGNSGGILGTKAGGDKSVLRWNSSGLVDLTGRLLLPKASAVNNFSPGLIFEVNQNFLFDGEYLNYFGFGAHSYNDGGGLGTNVYMAGFYGLDFFTGGSQRMRINTNGNIGIGTATPSQKLEIAHNDATGGIVLNRVNAGTNSKSEIKFNYNGTQKYAIGNDLNNNGTNLFYVWCQASASAPIIVNTQGKVSIGGIAPPTTSSIYKLFVEGGVVTRDVKVTALAFPDYVFDNDYKLMPLSDLEAYINKNHHLPEIPSAKEIDKNEGFEIGEMQTLLVKKIEEQTLYIIDLQKQMNELKAQLLILKNK